MPHQRRRSGHLSTTASATDVRKQVTVSDMSKPRRPAMSRKHTPVSAHKLGRSQREREREVQDAWDGERESFPQFCMTCEKQFTPHDGTGVYCSETCRIQDQSAGNSSQSAMPRSFSVENNYPRYLDMSPDLKPRDIVPQASPSRPTSLYLSASPPATPGTAAYHSSAISALRSLNLNTRPPSPPSPTESSSGQFWPFSGRSAATSPSTSYTRPSATYLSSTYDGGFNGYYGLSAMDRPLPSRMPTSHSRPKSIDLLTPLSGR